MANLQEFLAFAKALGIGQPQQQQQGGGLDLRGLLQEMRNDPQGDYNKQWTKTGPGGGFDMAKSAGFFGAPTPPEVARASQGMTAQNQWEKLQYPGSPVSQLIDQATQFRQSQVPIGMPDPGVVTGHSGYESHTPEGMSRLEGAGRTALVGHLFNPVTGQWESNQEGGTMRTAGMVPKAQRKVTAPMPGLYNFPAGGVTSYTPPPSRSFGFGGLLR